MKNLIKLLIICIGTILLFYFSSFQERPKFKIKGDIWCNNRRCTLIYVRTDSSINVYQLIGTNKLKRK